jgi:hypothetical protein
MATDNKMSYQMAARLKNQSLGSVIADQLISGEGYGSSIGKAIGLKTQARVTRLKAKFDPLNIAKFMTGGSRLGPAILGKMLGRSRKDIEYFTGRARPVSTTTKIGKLEKDGGGDSSGMDGMLNKIYDFMKKNREEDTAARQKQNNFAEEKLMESERTADRRHKDLLKAIEQLKKDLVPVQTAEKVEEQGSSILGDLADMKRVYDILKTAGGWLMTVMSGPLGLASSISALILTPFALSSLEKEKIDKDPYAKEYDNNAYALSVRSKLEGGNLTEGQAAAQLQQKALKQVPRRTVEDFVKSDLTDKELVQELGADREGLKKWLAENPKREAMYQVPMAGMQTQQSNTPPTPAATPAGETGGAPTATPAASETGGAPAPTSTPPAPMATPEAVPNMGQQLSSVMGQNTDMKLADFAKPLESVVNNLNSLNKSTTTGKSSLPAVRNLEDTFQRMIMNSTRVV